MVDHPPRGALIGVVVVLAGFVLVPFGLDAVASKTIADLAGLCYLIASPWLYTRVRQAVRATAAAGAPSQLPIST